MNLLGTYPQRFYSCFCHDELWETTDEMNQWHDADVPNDWFVVQEETHDGGLFSSGPAEDWAKRSPKPGRREAI